MLVTNRIPAQRKDTIPPMHVTAIALSQVRGFIAFVLVFLAFWAKLRREEEWTRSQFGETYATYAHQTAALVPYLF
jgi:protein-S-isoprenylcysteine O-methyltransferase Ste14